MHILSPGYRSTNVAALYASAGGGLLDGSESDGTNIVPGSVAVDFSSGWGGLGGTLTANNALAPDGTTTAARFLEDTSTARHGTYAFVQGITSGAAHTYSFYAKSITRQYFQIIIGGGGGAKPYAYFDLVNGTVTNSGSEAPDGSTTIVSTACAAAVNGFYKCSVRCIVDASSSNVHFQAMPSDVATYGSPLDAGSPSFTGNASNGIYIWRPKIAA